MKIQYKSVTGNIEIEVEEDWGNCVLELNRADYNSERKDHRTDRKYHGAPITVEESESESYAGFKRERGQVQTGDIVDNLVRKEENERLHHAVDKLPTDQRELVNALFFDDVKPVDYAKAKNVSKSAVSQQLSRALKNLKKYLS